MRQDLARSQFERRQLSLKAAAKFYKIERDIARIERDFGRVLGQLQREELDEEASEYYLDGIPVEMKV